LAKSKDLITSRLAEKKNSRAKKIQEMIILIVMIKIVKISNIKDRIAINPF